ncbi:hypothetical protein GGI15_004846 [Coemansia interrupta]|uniref:Uncharacterized protein n=1 Tax=Coemansia interrupta TaxID=1126814 RepID=A0A9W8LEG8_9FUNG|nr:hypothetical protein GGI15_004846 [Coemansia interrupta]
MFAARRLLASALAAETGIPTSDQSSSVTLWTMQHIKLNTRRAPSWHLSIPLCHIPNITVTTAAQGRALARALKQRTLDYTSAIDYCPTTGRLLVSLSALALCDLSHAISAGLAHSYPVSGTLTPPVRIFKWSDSSGFSRNKLIADTLAQALCKLSEITPGGRSSVCLEIARGRRLASTDTQAVGVEKVALRRMPRMFTALAAAGRMWHDKREGSLKTCVLLEAGLTVPLADEQGCVSQTAKDACTLFEQMCADNVVKGEMWCHFVPDSSLQNDAHWHMVVCVAQLAYEGVMQVPVPVVNRLCFARKCSGLPKVTGAAPELALARNCLVLGTRPSAPCPAAVARANSGHYILKIYRRLARSQPSSDATHSGGSLSAAASQVAVLVSALPETLYRAVAQQRTALLVDYFTRLAHAAAKCMAGDEPRNCAAVLADAFVVLRIGLQIIVRGLDFEAMA